LSASEDRKSAKVIDAGLGELNKVRDILFGREMAGVDERFAKMESVIDDKLTKMSDRIAEHLTQLEQTFESKVAEINSDIEKESSSRESHIAETESQLAKAIDVSQQTLTTAINAAEDSAQQDMLEMRSYMDKQQQESNKQFADNIDSLRADLTEMFKKQAQDLQSSKVGRESLALMLDEITVKLRKES